ncbi:MAG: UxaA family hydrolase [Dehalococcoidales bacterium]|nr:UxaA family hydrolase [Dehalococcoidales bacterium]
MKRSIMINEKDNTGTCFAAIKAGDKVNIVTPSGEVVQEIISRNPVPFGHKIALSPIKKGEKVLKYGEVIGVASKAIRPGDHVHVHNVESAIVPGN